MNLSTLHSITHDGAQVYITLRSNDSVALNREANLLYNYGYVCSVPDSYRPTIDTVVTLPSNHYRLSKVARALALGDVAHKGRRGHKSTREAVSAKVAAIYRAIRAEFAPTESRADINDTAPFALCSR